MSSSVWETVMKLRPIDDVFFQKLMEDREVCEEILRVIMEDDQLVVVQVIPQSDVKNLQGRSVRLDALCVLGDGSSVNAEVQKDNSNLDHFRRVRYNASCITANLTGKGDEFSDVPNVAVIYISEKDLFQKGRVIYHARSTVEETGEQVDDGYTSIYVNTEVKDNTKISELMECFMQKLVENTRLPHLSARVRQFKVEEEGVSVMCNIVEAYANEKAAEARAQAHEQGFEQGLEQGHEQGLEQGLEKIAYLYVKGYISYDLALEQVGSKELLDRLIASQE